MKKKILVMLMSCLILVTNLAGCEASSAKISDLRGIQANYTTTSNTTNYKMSYTEQQQIIYAQVSDRSLLDLSTLGACTDNEIQQVSNYMNTVDNILIGQATPNEDTIDPCFTDYLLAQFEQTPYYWQRSKTIIRGIDETSRAVIVDVTYNTIDFNKDVLDDSHIVKGDPDYSRKMEVRFNRYITILDMKYKGSQYDILEYEAALNEFESVYGEVEDIYNEQRNLTLTETVYETGNQRTYTGLVNSTNEDCGGTMTVRYVLVPKYVLGINLGITCEHMYITDYRVDNDFTEGKETFNLDGYQEAANSVYALLYSFFTCIDESDYQGLYKLTDNFASVDKYYADMFETTYSKHENITLSIFDITGTHISCAVKVTSKVRARGANMTFPCYDERYYFEIDLVDDVLKVRECVLLSRVLTGEPDIVNGEADLSGFVSMIELNNDDKLAIEDLICNFGALQLNNDAISNAFSEVVDISIPTNDLNTLKSNMLSLTGVRKSVWLVNYQQGTSSYASVKCREQYQAEDNSIVEAEVTYDFLFKGGKWYISGYTITGSGRLDTTNLATVDALCLLEPGKIISYTSQVRGTQSVNVDNLSDISVTFEHDEYEPQLKSGSQELGYRLYLASDITDEMIEDYADLVGYDISELEDTITYVIDNDEDMDDDVLIAINAYDYLICETVAVKQNIANNLYTEYDNVDSITSSLSSRWQEQIDILSEVKGTYEADYKKIINIYTEISQFISF